MAAVTSCENALYQGREFNHIHCLSHDLFIEIASGHIFFRSHGPAFEQSFLVTGLSSQPSVDVKFLFHFALKVETRVVFLISLDIQWNPLAFLFSTSVCFAVPGMHNHKLL